MPLQDVLNLDNDARMNFPGRPDGNWQWRYQQSDLTDFLAARLRDLTKLYGREIERASDHETQDTPEGRSAMSATSALTHNT
jgi:4-alpha-glucanotransferase